jgi:hypothetical protein
MFTGVYYGKPKRKKKGGPQEECFYPELCDKDVLLKTFEAFANFLKAVYPFYLLSCTETVKVSISN